MNQNEEMHCQIEQLRQELSESESIVQECLEEKKKAKSSQGIDIDLSKAIETLRNQLSSQQEVVGKYEAKIKKRESELREKTQELRKQRADTANAKLQIAKLSKEKDEFKEKIALSESQGDQLEAMKKELSKLQQKHYRIVEELETK